MLLKVANNLQYGFLKVLRKFSCGIILVLFDHVLFIYNGLRFHPEIFGKFVQADFGLRPGLLHSRSKNERREKPPQERATEKTYEKNKKTSHIVIGKCELVPDKMDPFCFLPPR